MVRIADIDPASLDTISAADLARATPVAPPPAPAAPAAPVVSDAVSLGDLQAARPLTADQELAVEGQRYWKNRNTLPASFGEDRARLIEPTLYATHFQNEPDAYQRFGVSGVKGAGVLDGAGKAHLFNQLQRANVAIENERTRQRTELGLPDPEGDAILGAQAAAEAQQTGAAQTGLSAAAHGISNVTATGLVNPALDVLGIESPADQRARLLADRALQSAQAQQNPIAAGVGQGVGSLTAPESIAAMTITGGLAAPFTPATAAGRVAQAAGEGAGFGGAVMPLQQAAAGHEVTPADLAIDTSLGAIGGAAGRAVGMATPAVVKSLPPAAQGAAQFAAGAATSGAVNAAGAGASAALQGHQLSAGDYVREFIVGTALHVPAGIPDAVETMRSARDRIRAADPQNALLSRLDAEIAQHAIEAPAQKDRENIPSLSPTSTPVSSGGSASEAPPQAPKILVPENVEAPREQAQPVPGGNDANRVAPAEQRETRRPGGEAQPPVVPAAPVPETPAAPAAPLNAAPDVFQQAVDVVRQENRGSVSLIQRKLGIGYAQAQKLMSRMEAEGIVGPATGAGPREVLKPAEISSSHAPGPVYTGPDQPAPAAQEISREQPATPAARPAVERPAVRGLPPGEERSGGQPETPPGGDAAHAPGSEPAARRARAVAGIRESLKPFRNVALEDDGHQLHLVMPNRQRLRWHLVDAIEPAEANHVRSYLRSALAANEGKATFTAGDGRKLRLPSGPEQWAAMSPEERAQVLDKFPAGGHYDHNSRAITTTHDVGDDSSIGAEEVFHASAAQLKEADRPTYGRMMERYENEDVAFRAFQLAKGKGHSKAAYFDRIRKGVAHLPPDANRYAAPRERAAVKLLEAAQQAGVLLSDHEFEAFKNDMGGLHPDVLVDYRVRDGDGNFIKDKKTGEYKLTREGKLLEPFVDEDGYSNATRDMDPRQIERYQDRVIRELVMSREQKIEEAARHFHNLHADPELRKAAEKILGPVPDEDLPFAVRRQPDQLTIAGEVQGRATVGDSGRLFGAGDETPRPRASEREIISRMDDAELLRAVEKFALVPKDFRTASAFSDGDPSPAFAYGVKRALEGKGVGTVKGMTTGEAREAVSGHKAAREGMSPNQRLAAEAPAAAAAAEGQERLFAVRKRPDEEGEGGEPTKVSPNIVKSAAILAAAKTLRSVDPELFDAPPHGSEVPLRVSAADMKSALDQMAKDWALDPAAMEKYRGPVEQAARKLLAEARRQGSFDAALASLEKRPREDVKGAIKASTSSADPDKVILSAKDAVRQAMRIREQGRTEGLREAVKLRQEFIQEASKYLTPEERGPLMRDLAAIGNEADLYARLQKIYDAFGRAEKRRAVDDVRELIRGADIKHLRPEFKSAMETLTGNLDDKSMSERTRTRAESLAAHVQSLPEEERAGLPAKALTLLERMGKEPLDSFSMDELKDLGDSIRAIVAQNQLKNRLIVGKHLREVAKVERTVVHEVMKNNKALGLKGEEGSRKELADKGLAGRLVEFTDSPEVLAVSAGGEGGELHRHLYDELRKAENGHIGTLRRYRGELQDLLAKHKLTDRQIIEWREKTRKVELSPLPSTPAKSGKRGFEALAAAEDQVRDMQDVFGADSGIPENRKPEEEAGGGRVLELTGPEALSAWLYDQNEGARGKLLANPVNLERFGGQSSLNRTLTPADLEKISATLTPFERDLGAMILKQNKETGEEIAKIHVMLKGYDLPREENYFPLLTDQKQKRRVLDELATQYADKWLEQSGFLKERVHHALPILLSDALDTHLWHLRQAVSFINKAIPVRNARVLLGAPKVREAIDGHIGKTWTPRMERLLKDFSGAELGARTEAEQLAAKIARNAAAATLGLRPTTVATNFIGAPLGLLTQMDAREASTFVKKFINLKANTIDAEKYFGDRIAPHNPYLADRYDPNSDLHRVAVIAGSEGAGAGGSVPGVPSAKTVAGQRWRDFQEWSLSWMNRAERAAAVAGHRAMLELHPDWTDAQAAEHIEKMTRRTQNAISSIDMSEFLRQTKRQPLMGLAFMFTNQAAKLRDTMRLAALTYKRSARTPADQAKLAATAGLVFASAAIVPAAVRALWAQVRHGGQEQEDSKTKSISDYLTGAVADVGDIAHPVVGDAVRLLTSKDGSANDTINSRALAQISQGLRGAYTEASKLGETDRKKPRELLPAVYRVISNLSRGVATFAGVPLDAPLTVAEGLGRAAQGRDPEFSAQQELTRLRRRLDTGAADPRSRTGDLSTGEFRRYRVLDRTMEQVKKIRDQEAAGRITGAKADQIVEQLLAAAGRVPADAP